MMRFSALLFIFLTSTSLYTNIAPECAGVSLPADYDEAKQQAFLQNYFAAALIQTPLAPVIAFQKKNKSKVSLGLELAFIPPLNCQERLVFNGSKTQNTNITPILPRPKLIVQLPNFGPVFFKAGLTLIPPIPTPIGTVFQAGAEFALAFKLPKGFDLGAAFHLEMARVRAELAVPIEADGEAHDDLFFTASLGGSIDLAYKFPWEEVSWLTPYLSMGYASVSAYTIVGDDLAVTQNSEFPWHGVLIAGGFRVLTCKDQCDFAVEVSSAIPIMTTVKARLSYAW